MRDVAVVKKEFLTNTTDEWNTIFQRKQDVINEAINVYPELKKQFHKHDSSFK